MRYKKKGHDVRIIQDNTFCEYPMSFFSSSSLRHQWIPRQEWQNRKLSPRAQFSQKRLSFSFHFSRSLSFFFLCEFNATTCIWLPSLLLTAINCFAGHPSPWKDIAVLTSDSTTCNFYTSESQNVKAKYHCVNVTGFLYVNPPRKFRSPKINSTLARKSLILRTVARW